MPPMILASAWGAGGLWLATVWYLHLKEEGEHRGLAKQLDNVLKYSLAIFYTVLGVYAYLFDAVLIEDWLALKAFLFGLVFWAAIMIDVRFKALTPVLIKLVEEGSSESLEDSTLAIMNRSRFWVRTVYLLIVITAFLGTTKFIG